MQIIILNVIYLTFKFRSNVQIQMHSIKMMWWVDWIPNALNIIVVKNYKDQQLNKPYANAMHVPTRAMHVLNEHM